MLREGYYPEILPLLEFLFQLFQGYYGDDLFAGRGVFGVVTLQKGIHKTLSLKGGSKFFTSRGAQDGEFSSHSLLHHAGKGC